MNTQANHVVWSAEAQGGGVGGAGSGGSGGGGGERRLALRVVTMPKDTNQYGTIFGGVILSYIDQAGFVEARRHGVHRWVTASLDAVEFKAPVRVGDVVNFWAHTTRMGTKSVTVRIEVEAQRYNTGESVVVTSAQLTMVSVDADGKPIPFASAATV
jgi:acyl-CoA thioesterase YciA